MWVQWLDVFLAPLMLVASASPAVPVPLPAGADFTQLVSQQLLARSPRVAAIELVPAGVRPPLEATLIQYKTCADAGYHLTYRIVVRNRSLVPVNGISVRNRYPAGTKFIRGTRPPDAHDPIERLIIWNEAGIGPSQILSYTFTQEVQAGGKLTDELHVLYQKEDGTIGEVLTDHIIYGSCSNPPAAVTVEEEPFTLVVLPDTQKYSRFNPQIFIAQTKWIAEHAEREKIAYVLHVGDLVDKNTRTEWDVAQRAMNQLDNVVPYQVVPGNHDMGSVDFDTSADVRDTRLYNEYFPPSKFRPQLHFGGTYELGSLDNSYQYFQAGGLDWLVVALEFGPRQKVVDWANEVIVAHPNHRVIVVTHSYLTPTDTLDEGNMSAYGVGDDGDGPHDGRQLWEQLVSKHKNVVMVFSGHDKGDGAGRHVGQGIHGNSVYEMMANYQHFENGGNGFLRLLRVDTVAGKIDVKTFSPFLNTFRKDGDNEFAFEGVDFDLPDPVNALPGPQPPPAAPRKPGAFSAIICHPAERGCVPFLPTLGINFQRAQDPAQQPRICSQYNGNACQPNRPNLGVRFAEATADILPGDCRVLEDNVITTPPFQDAFNRRGALADFSIRPLVNSDNDFKRLIHENALRGIAHTERARQQLVVRGQGQGSLRADYEKMLSSREAAFKKIVQEAIYNAEQAVGRGCGEAGAKAAGQEMAARLAGVRAAYQALLTQRRAAYINMQQVYAATYDFAATYEAHAREDERLEEQLRAEWEAVMDEFKARTLTCAREEKFAADVETSWCESNDYADFVVRGAPEPARAQLTPPVAPPDTRDLNPFNALIEEGEVRGQVCGGAPGDPWWADDCSCQCNELVPIGGGNDVISCQAIRPITRHDINVISQEECLVDFVKHQDPFF